MTKPQQSIDLETLPTQLKELGKHIVAFTTKLNGLAFCDIEQACVKSFESPDDVYTISVGLKAMLIATQVYRDLQQAIAEAEE